MQTEMMGDHEPRNVCVYFPDTPNPQANELWKPRSLTPCSADPLYISPHSIHVPD